MVTKGKKILGTEGKDVVFERFNGRASFVIKSRTHLIQERVKMISFTKVSQKKRKNKCKKASANVNSYCKGYDNKLRPLFGRSLP